jgi:hypothetical protein
MLPIQFDSAQSRNIPAKIKHPAKLRGKAKIHFFIAYLKVIAMQIPYQDEKNHQKKPFFHTNPLILTIVL